jgi:hypothetical protein
MRNLATMHGINKAKKKSLEESLLEELIVTYEE